MPDEWEEFKRPEEDDEWAEFRPIEEPEPAPAPEEESTLMTRSAEAWGKLRNLTLGESLGAVGENVLTAVTGLGGTIAGGITGLNEASRPPGDDIFSVDDYESGRPQYKGEPDPVGAVRYAQDAMTYQPRLEASQDLQEVLAIPFEWYEQKVYDIAHGAGAPHMTTGATGAYTALMMLPAAIGAGWMRNRKRGGSAGSRKQGTQTLRQQADDLYARADAAQGGVTAKSYNAVLDRIEAKLAEQGFDRALHPDTYAALRNLREKAGNNQSLKGTEVNRRVINNARGALKPDDARMASQMMDIYDDWLGSLSRKDMVFGDPKAVGLYREARSLWHRKMKADELEWAIERAEYRAGANYSGAAFETAVRQEFAAILKNKKRRRMFNQQELAMIRNVVDGTLPQNFLRLVGKVAPRGVISAAPGAALMTANPTAGAALWAVGEGAKRGATALTRRQANQAVELAQRGN